MPIYDAEVDPAAENNSHSLMLRLVGPDRRVLDVGCATGYLGEALIAQGCAVSGVELDPEAAQRAQKVLDDVLVTDLETADLVEHFGPGSFDVVVFGDVLEHIRNPLRLLRNAVGLLADKGSIVISIPNVTHAAVRLALLQGRWEYHDTGLLDRTHVQFFNRQTLVHMVRDAGLIPIDVRCTTAGTFATEIAFDPNDLPPGIVAWVESRPDSDVYQFVLRAIKDDADGAVEVLRESHEQTESLLRLKEEALVAAKAELAANRAELDALAQNSARQAERAAQAENAFAALSNTRSARVLRGPRSAYGWTRHLFRH